MDLRLNITIIGPGRVGRALGTLAVGAGWRLSAVSGGRDTEKMRRFAESLGAEVLPSAQAAARGQLVLLTVHDGAIGKVCQQLAQAGGLDHKPVVAHCSGALGSEELSAAADLGCPVASMHPLQTFPSVESALENLPGAYCFLEGDERAVAVIQDQIVHGDKIV